MCVLLRRRIYLYSFIICSTYMYNLDLSISSHIYLHSYHLFHCIYLTLNIVCK